MENDYPITRVLRLDAGAFTNDSYDIVIEAQSVRHPAFITFTDKKSKESYSIPEEILRGHSGDYWGGASESAIEYAGRLLHNLNRIKTEIKVNYANINKMNPELKRYDNDGTDIGSPFPHYCLNESIEWRGYDVITDDEIGPDSPPEVIAAYHEDKIISYTPSDDEAILQWVDADSDWNPVGLRKAGWGIFFYGRMYFNGPNSEKPLYFAEWDDLQGIANILENMKDLEALKVAYALLGKSLEVESTR